MQSNVSLVTPITPSPELLLHRGDRGTLPVGAALDIVRLPLVLALKKRPGAVEDDDDPAVTLDDEQLTSLPVLAPELYELSYHYTDRFGVQHRVLISADHRLGLPYGQDGDVLIALFRLIDEDRQRVLAGQPARVIDGEFVGITVRAIARAMGHENVHGKLMRRIRAALRRLAFVRILTASTEFRDTGDIASALLTGAPGAHPVLPARGRSADRAQPLGKGARRFRRKDLPAPSAREEDVTWVLEYRWRTEYLRGPDGDNWIVHLRLNPRWFNQAVSGWVAWIDTERYRALGGPLAKRLYQLMAVEAAYGTIAPWTFSLDALRRACAISERRQANDVVKSLVPAAEELCALEILSSVEHRKVKRGEHELTFVPGRTLVLASLLRGSAAADLHETRVQLAFLRAFGVDASLARTLIEVDAAAVHEALAYALYLKETAPQEVQRSWSRMIVERIEQKRTNAGVVGFEAWKKRRLHELETNAPTDGARSGTRKRPKENAVHVEATDPLPQLTLADDAWGRALAQLQLQELPTIFHAWFAETALLSISADRVRVRAPSDFHAEKICRSWGTRLEAFLAAEFGHPVQLEVNGMTPAAFIPAEIPPTEAHSVGTDQHEGA